MKRTDLQAGAIVLALLLVLAGCANPAEPEDGRMRDRAIPCGEGSQDGELVVCAVAR